jgi:hypothetical protein
LCANAVLHPIRFTPLPPLTPLTRTTQAHTLGDDPRGATLEALVCRLKVIRSNPQVVERNLPAAKMRILAASGACVRA